MLYLDDVPPVGQQVRPGDAEFMAWSLTRLHGAGQEAARKGVRFELPPDPPPPDTPTEVRIIYGLALLAVGVALGAALAMVTGA